MAIFIILLSKWLLLGLVSAWGAPNKPVVFSLASPIHSIHPFTLDNGNFLVVTDLVVERLAHLDDDGTYRPVLASSWTISKDGKVFTFKLRPDVQFSDGHRLIAEDVVYSFKMLFDPALKGAAWQNIFVGVQKVEAGAPGEVRFTCDHVDFELWKMVATQLRIYPSGYFLRARADWDKTILGTGPYVLSRFVPGKQILLKQNPKWWGRGDPQLAKTHTFPEVLFRVQPDAWTAAAMVGKGEMDVAELKSPVDVDLVKEMVASSHGKTFYHHSHARNFAHTLGIEMNLKNPVLANIHVREALNLLLNREALATKVFHGHLVPSQSYFGRSSPFFKPGHGYVYEPKRAAKLLKEEGWKQAADQPVLVNKDGQTLKLQILYEDANLEPFLGLLKEDAANIGVVFNLQKTEPSNTWKVLNEKKFELFASIASDWSSVIPSVLQSGAAFNYVGLADKQVDKWLAELPSAFDPKQRLLLEMKIAARIDQLTIKIVGFESTDGVYLLNQRIEVPKGSEDRIPFYWRLKNN